ncbi:MgtC/SapB family protein [Parapedobacter indicus]|uniref:Putative Mg2+ transporter-C (MgtC) family protein n=1 Tax=Parapedobacter indicus TaxID=1477437 RepID=A0A1I3R708_9SPHI|nr:MgtC/SapB family protein [Parapedobacter indicus]PPL00385.1 putative Mg2+ transporter-C (MgtC) family protein [Parapedobacter indicus]SFJ42108.1 putative Mg2+ transporter-C (MgtC) family protein [Parapedobacter indicus]
MDFFPENEDLISIAVSIIAGSLVGLEREYKNKSAGFRTIVLICLGATAFTIVSRYGVGSDDRIAANIITGIGFIGAGVIFKDKFSVMGLTTAAVIWIVAGIGMAAGIGYYGLSLSLSVITVVILSVFNKVESAMERVFLTRTIFVVFQDMDITNMESLKHVMDKHRINHRRKTVSKRNRRLSVVFEMSADRKNLQAFNNEMISLTYVEEFYYNS